MMARKASTESVQADMSPPNYRAAVAKIRTINAKVDKIAGVNGDIAQIWAGVEGFKVNKKAGKIFRMLDNLTPEDRVDVMRSFNGLCDAAAWDQQSEDMMDKASGTVVPMRFKQPESDEGEGGILDGEDIDLEGNAEAASGDAAIEGTLVEEPLAGTGEGEQIPGENGGAEPIRSASGDGFQEATDEELKAQAGRGKGGRKASVSRIGKPDEPFTGDNSDLTK